MGLYNAYGGFIFKYSYVYNLYSSGMLTAAENSAVSGYMFNPSMPLLSASLGPSPVLQILAAAWLWPYSSLITGYLLSTRAIFGMSFDRMFPETLSRVNDRTHSPVNATVFNIIVAIVWLVIMFTSFGVLVSAANTSFWYGFIYFLFSLAAIALSYKRPDLWAKGPKRTFFGIPDLSLLGALSAAGTLWLMEVSTLGITLTAWDATIVWMIAGLLVLVIVTSRNMKRGINITKIFAEIPPP